MSAQELIVQTHMRMHKNSALSFDDMSEFPINPYPGQFALVEGILYIYAALGGLETWFPLTNRKSSHVHYQAVPSIQWRIAHNYGTTDLIYFVYDHTGRLMPANADFVDDNHFEINLATSMKGKVVVFAHSDLWVPRLETTDGYAEKLMLNQHLKVSNEHVILDASGVTVGGTNLSTWIQQNTDRIGILEYALENNVDPAITAQRLADLEAKLTEVHWRDIIDAPPIEDLQSHPAQSFTNVEVANLRSGKSATGENLSQTIVYGGDDQPNAEVAGVNDIWFDTSGDSTVVRKKNADSGEFEFVAQIASEMIMKHSNVVYVTGESDKTHTFTSNDINGLPEVIVIKPNFVTVYLNRQLLRKNEYKIIDQNTIEILVDLAANDELEIVTA
ncbi:hypothetical protein [Pseudoalteromonas umbrosa]|uniref:hypothetical protein n=1 Tax=Pseudoalteromonas umbrosa TaxID=3048489 RepID=UPI0024C284A9|nr:hypothetical protein [Pseudoalteromonas sp. B95]MDK1290238.1 hypothetical protein [Pseudoalteromonas sp. B95]